MRIGGLQKFSLIDYPKKVAAVIFTQGCNFRCPFCHNPDLVLPEQYNNPISEEEVLAFLEKRKGQLTGVVITGGEPTIHKDLGDFLRKIKSLGYAIKLDTNGSDPESLEALVDGGLVDYIAMDIKTSLPRYSEACGVDVDIQNIKKSISFIINSGVDYHFRTTLVSKYISSKDLEEISKTLSDAQARQYVIQKLDTKPRLLDETLKDGRVYSEEEFKALQQKWERK